MNVVSLSFVYRSRLQLAGPLFPRIKTLAGLHGLTMSHCLLPTLRGVGRGAAREKWRPHNLVLPRSAQHCRSIGKRTLIREKHTAVRLELQRPSCGHGGTCNIGAAVPRATVGDPVFRTVRPRRNENRRCGLRWGSQRVSPRRRRPDTRRRGMDRAHYPERRGLE